MLKDDIMKLLNLFFEKGKIPLKITEMFLYRPVYHEPPFENLEPINEATRLVACDPVFIDFMVEHDKHRYEYQFRCRNDKGKFVLKLCWLKFCDIFPNEDPKKLERNMESNKTFLARAICSVLEFMSKR